MRKDARTHIDVQLDGIVGDRHRSYTRTTWAGDKQRKGTLRRNERQWSAVAEEELAAISAAMDLDGALTAASVGANLCISGVPNFSQLPRGSLLRFPSGAELMVEEYNPPCLAMGKQLASMFGTRSGKALTSTAFSKAAKSCRGLVGVVEAAGRINAGDSVTIVVTVLPPDRP